MAIVYLHKRKDTNEVFYVGIGGSIERAYQTKNRKNKYWLNIVNKFGYSVEIIVSGETWVNVCQIEIDLIKKYGRKDLNEGTLVNLTDGGEGLNNPSIDTRNKLKYPKTDEHKEKLRNSKLGTKQSEKTINKRLSHNFHNKKEYKEKMSKALSGDNNPMKKEINKAKLRKPKPIRSEEHCKNISEAKKGKEAHNKNVPMEKYICEICNKEIGGLWNLKQHKNKH